MFNTSLSLTLLVEIVTRRFIQSASVLGPPLTKRMKTFDPKQKVVLPARRVAWLPLRLPQPKRLSTKASE